MIANGCVRKNRGEVSLFHTRSRRITVPSAIPRRQRFGPGSYAGAQHTRATAASIPHAPAILTYVPACFAITGRESAPPAPTVPFGPKLARMPLHPPAAPQKLSRLARAALSVGLFATALWWILIVDTVLPLDLAHHLGVYPRRIDALHGILTAPLVHGSVAHLAANTPPLVLLGTAMLYNLPRASRIALPLIWVLSGLGVWLFARPSFHIGISGLTHGMMFFVLLIGVLRRDRASIALVMIVSFLYGGMVWGVLPRGPEVSFEYHLSGALAGLAAAAALRYRDPLAGPRLYEAPVAAADEDDPVIGDLWRDDPEPPAPEDRPAPEDQLPR